MIIGLTGCIGAGKSTVAKMFENYDYAVQDADAVVHYIYTKDSRAIEMVNLSFDGVVVNGAVDRSLLREHITKNPEDKEKLEQIIHPIVQEYRKNFIGRNLNCVLDVPLLFEAGVFKECDVIVVVACGEEIRKQRVMDRGHTESVFEMFNNAQMEQDEKIAGADFVVYSDTDIMDTEQQVRDIIEQLA